MVEFWHYEQPVEQARQMFPLKKIATTPQTSVGRAELTI